MLRRFKDVDDQTSGGPATPAARAALASSVVAHAVVELETQLIELTRQLAAPRMTHPERGLPAVAHPVKAVRG